MYNLEAVETFYLPSNLTRPYKMIANSTSFLLASCLATRPIIPFLELLFISTPIQIAWMLVVVISPHVVALVHFFGTFARCQLKDISGISYTPN